MATKIIAVKASAKRSPFVKRLVESRYLLLLLLPCLAYYILLRYVPMWGVLITFQKFQAFKGFFHSPWVWFQNYAAALGSRDFLSLLSNTFLLGVMSFIFQFPTPILFALILNEVRAARFKKLVQTVSYMPFFISTVVVVGIINMVLNPRNGVVNNMIAWFGMEKINFLVQASSFRWVYILSGIWQNTGFGAIIYLAALAGVDPQLYEAAIIDGANKRQQILHITLPSIAPVIITMMLLNTGSLVDVGFEKVYLMENPAVQFSTDVFATYVYRQGIQGGNMSYGATFDVLNSIINLFFICVSNWLARRYSDTSLW